MERTCEFCAALRPIIYCTPDAAHLCLSCDAKVHSANALSSRHLRTLLCEVCRSFPTYLQCLDHQMFLCRGCDRTLHVSSSQHQKRTIRGYVGCPSAKDFAALWGFHVNEVDKAKFVSTSGSDTSSVVKTFDASGRSRSHIAAAGNKVLYKGQEKGTSFILQQILELSRLQLVKKNIHSPLILGEGKDGATSLKTCASEKFEQSLNEHVNHSENRSTDIQQRDNLLQELKMTSFTQLENFPLPSPILLPFHGESLWNCKSPAESQIWSQNMQDLGVCDELVSRDDFNIPEVDLTFQNFDEIFNSDQDPTGRLFDNKDESYSHSSMEKDVSLSKSNNHDGKGMEASSATSSSCIFSYALMDKDSEPSDEVCNHPMSTNMESARPIQPSLSTLSFADSRMSLDSAGTDFPDRARGEPSCSSPYHRDCKHSLPLNNVDAATKIYKEKQQFQLQEKQIRRKARSLVKKRVKGRYEKGERYDSSTVAFSRSY
ncbi:hypothetical protein IC582_022872 [Cucumis melo]|uniref:Zinc finger protein At1g68190 isoform X1 n=2 Tax=Cucumis melo TaxID=3656 RepID=A0A1S3BG93_CUCME|nr:putative zinc finger protein At1g68190 isoform X1 [Cucumis melo]XP_008446651.2 putative zinc finger protein At1g68190 isoform X1 [Cucumis melo]XP_050947020.1 putative zinc finger protein At1g68190 isoform X1 [Cucumis melo]XP_050947021.1 putative zinc finger protein At1g68190 isoform X1 [Cucumis melo]XP_050947022.1 putative zinc finger protein At1g68190 isoform X1 [Cucumis melo]XP_050947023.1 putative zinc finger protein At1g68190 isoform X1 [Cucumis melo]